MSVNYQPTLARVLVSLESEGEHTTQSGLILSTHHAKNRATVVAVGPGARYWYPQEGRMVQIPTSFKEGDQVIVPEHGLTEVRIEGETYHLINEDQILAKKPDA